MFTDDYRAKLKEEQQIFQQNEQVHNLPDIFHYWSNTYILPKLEAVGIRGSQELFADTMSAQCERNTQARFLSIGAGNCDLEIDLAQRLQAAGHYGFVIDCLDLNEDMLERGRAAAVTHAVDAQVDFLRGDFNHWVPERDYDAVIAIQALHHVVNLEGLFAGIHDSLRPQGVFAVSDMIGRNGHMRWPEAMEIIHEYWRRLPPSYRFNHQLQRYEELFQDWDCSVEGFEGVRSQDILPLLVERFGFERFVAFGNVVDPFLERGFGHNFDALSSWDRAFVDEIHRRDEAEMAAGNVKPTHMFAVMSKRAQATLAVAPFTPEFCVRRTDVPLREPAATEEPYAWDWPHDHRKQLEFVCRHLARVEGRADQLGANYSHLVKEFEKRTAWALGLNGQLETMGSRLVQLDRELHDRTDWAMSLNSELQNRTLRARVKRLLR
jgi:SAM-dependent methyltransferase